MRLVQSSRFKEDVTSTLDWTLKNFGNRARYRYTKVIDAALSTISRDPFLAGSREHEDTRFYHLRHSKNVAGVDGIKIKAPRHFVVFRVNGDKIEILRLLHERMDILFHLVETK